MSRRGSREQCRSGHALALARWEKNQEGWLKGDFFGLAAKRADLQDLVGGGGTLWVIVSRKQSSGPRNYSLSFRLENCRAHSDENSGGFGRYAVVGDPNRSALFASNMANLLLLSLRFDPFGPIDRTGDLSWKNKNETTDRLRIIGQSLQTPRCLNAADVKLLEGFATEIDLWSVFVSYQRTENETLIASELSNALHRRGINVFLDQEAIRPGQKWMTALMNAIGRARFFVLIIGPSTHESSYVKLEVKKALDSEVDIIPVLAGGRLENWAEIENFQAVTYKRGHTNDVIGEVLTKAKIQS